jgi:hypothetical protein
MKKLITSVILLLSVASLTLATDASPTPAPTATPSKEQVAQCSNWVSDKLQASLADMLTKATSVAGDAKDFVVAQLPDVIRQLLLWKMAESIWECIFPIIVMIGFIIFAKQMMKKSNWENGEPNNGYAVISIVGWILTALSFLYFFFSVNITWLQIWLAPKVYLIEYARQMVSH